MNHAVLDIGKLRFNRVVYALRDGMRVVQGQIPVGGNFHLHVNPVAEEAGAQSVNAFHAAVFLGHTAHLLLRFRVARGIGHAA